PRPGVGEGDTMRAPRFTGFLSSFVALVAVLGSLVPPSLVPAQEAEELACPAEDVEAPPAAPMAARQVGGLPYRVVLPGLAADGALTVPPDPGPPGPAPDFLALEERLTAIIAGAGTPGRFAVAVTDLQTGDTIGVGLDRPQLAACVMN